MNKFLLSMAAVALAGSAFAADVTLNFSDINTTTDVTGDFTETALKTDGSVQAYAHWQPLQKVVLNGYTFTFTDGGGKTAPALYTTNTEGVLQIRLYVSNTMTITAPEGVTFGKMSFNSSNAKDDFKFTASVGNCSYASNVAEWANETPVNSVTLTASGTIRLLSMEISSEGGTIDPGTDPNPGTTGAVTHLETNDIDEAGIVGTYVEADLNSNPVVYGHWQPVEACNIGDWTFDFSYGADDRNLPAIYEAKVAGQKSIRLYNGSSMTLSAPADVKFNKIVATLLTPGDSYSCTPSVGAYAYDATAKTLTWTSDEYVTNVTFTSAGTIKFIAFDIYTDAEGETPNPVNPSNAIYDNTLMSESCGFTFTTEGEIQPWSISDKYGLKASAYIDNAVNASDAYAVSPVFDLTSVEGAATCTFEHAVNQFKNGNDMIAISELGQYCEVLTRQEGGQWEKAEVEFPASFSWTYVAASVDMSKYAGKKAQIGFHYTSTADVAGTWEIKNMKVTGTTAVSTVDTEAGEVRFFDLQGRQVVNPEKGLYIRVQGSKATKVML